MGLPALGVEPIRRKPPATATQLNWMSGAWEAPPPEPPEQLGLVLELPERVALSDDVSVVLAENGSQLIVAGFGVSLGRRGECLAVRLKGKPLAELPFHDLQLVIVASKGVSLSSDLLVELAQRGVRLSLLTSQGSPAAMLYSPTLHATVAVRRAQLAAESNGRGIELARAFVLGKLRNQEKLLRYFAKGLRKTDPARAVPLAAAAGAVRSARLEIRPRLPSDVDRARAILMGGEGAAGRAYWRGIIALLGERLGFSGRQHRGASDPVNAALNYGYGILYSHAWSAVLNAGLEPFAGVLHVDRSGKPSFVLDFIEEFRQPVVDRAVLSALNLGKRASLEGDRLTSDAREWIAARVLERLTACEPYQGKRFEIRSILQMQARAAATSLRHGSRYEAFTFRW